jgi:hypothetical protein
MVHSQREPRDEFGGPTPWDEFGVPPRNEFDGPPWEGGGVGSPPPPPPVGPPANHATPSFQPPPRPAPTGPPVRPPSSTDEVTRLLSARTHLSANFCTLAIREFLSEPRRAIAPSPGVD